MFERFEINSFSIMKHTSSFLIPPLLFHDTMNRKYADITQSEQVGHFVRGRSFQLQTTSPKSIRHRQPSHFIGRFGSLRAAHWLTFIWPLMTYRRCLGMTHLFPLGSSYLVFRSGSVLMSFPRRAFVVQFQMGRLSLDVSDWYNISTLPLPI